MKRGFIFLLPFVVIVWLVLRAAFPSTDLVAQDSKLPAESAADLNGDTGVDTNPFENG